MYNLSGLFQPSAFEHLFIVPASNENYTEDTHIEKTRLVQPCSHCYLQHCGNHVTTL